MYIPKTGIQSIKMTNGDKYVNPILLEDICRSSHYLAIKQYGGKGVPVIFLNKLNISSIEMEVDNVAADVSI